MSLQPTDPIVDCIPEIRPGTELHVLLTVWWQKDAERLRLRSLNRDGLAKAA